MALTTEHLSFGYQDLNLKSCFGGLVIAHLKKQNILLISRIKIVLQKTIMNPQQKTKCNHTIFATLSYYCSFLNLAIIGITIGYCIYRAANACEYGHFCERPYYEILYFFAAVACFIVSLIGWLLAAYSSPPTTPVQEKHLALGRFWNKLISLTGLALISFFLLILLLN